MKKLLTFLFLILVITSCEKDAEELLIGRWSEIESESVTITFSADGKYSLYHISDHIVFDPPGYGGAYLILADTLIIEKDLYMQDTIITSRHTFSVGREELKLTNLETLDVEEYKRVKYWGRKY